MSLSARMKAVIGMVTTGNSVCDVGCDHGYISISLVQEKITPAVVAMDINRGPLERAKTHVHRAGLQDYISLRLSDGLAGYQIGEAQTLICAGMGGPLMQKILTDFPDKTNDFTELILQPQSEIKEFRSFLREKGYSIVAEDMIYEDGIFYQVIKVIRGNQETEQTEIEDRYGPLLLKQQHPVLIQFLRHEWNTIHLLLQQIEQMEATEKIIKRKQELSKELHYLEIAGELCKMGGMK